MLTTLQRSGGIEALARQAGIEPAQALAETKQILPDLLAAYRDYPGGNAALLAMFEKQGGSGLAAEVMAVEPADIAAGRAILASTLGEAVAEKRQTGLWPLLAMLVSGYIAATAAASGPGMQRIDDLLGRAA
ncbi:MAG: hypothetical protein AB7F98_14750 [Novosphingobium sp.]